MGHPPPEEQLQGHDLPTGGLLLGCLPHLDRRVPSAPPQPEVPVHPTLLLGLLHSAQGCGAQLLTWGEEGHPGTLQFRAVR